MKETKNSPLINKITIRSLKLNIKRTIATCIGIILSTALICAVAGVFSSFQQTLLKRTKENTGDYHAVFYNIPKEEQKYILENRNVESYHITQGIGYAQLEGSINDYKPYLYLMEFDETSLNNFGLRLTEGRMPQNENELVISKHIKDNGGVTYKVGDKVTLDIGKRMMDGEELDQYNPYNNPKDSENLMEENLVIKETREFTIVGIIERPSMDIEGYSAPGYTVITTLSQIKDNANIAVKFTNINNTYDYVKGIAEDKSNQAANPDSWISKYNYDTNSELLRWSGVMRADDTMVMFYTLAGIVIGIIIVSSVFVIRNSFAISITEKMKQYGMLSSIGATKKQIKKNVLFEGMILGVIAIPIGILCGILATFILIQITTALIGGIAFSEEIEFVFSMPVIVVILSIILGFVTIYLSCIFSARKAAKISPIDAIRSNEDIKIKAKKVKSPRFVRKFFGVGGDIAYKNLKRNKKKYRTTVISLVVSITVFISLTTFMNYAFDMSGIYYHERDYNISMSAYYPAQDSFNLASRTEERIYKYFKNIAEKHNLEDYTIKRNTNLQIDFSSIATDEYKKLNEYNDGFAISINSIGEYAYKRYLKELNLKYDDYKDGIIYCDNSSIYNEGKLIKPFKIKENDTISGISQPTEKNINLKVLKITDIQPTECGPSTYGTFIISDELMDKLGNFFCPSMKINAEDATKLCNKIEAEKSDLDESGDEFKLYIYNYEEEVEEEKRMVLLISIFLYGFITVISLIGVTNIFNTITTNMNLRSKEFAMLKAIGMTNKEFNKMIRLESIFYGVKSLIIGISLGLGISYWMYKVVIGAEATSGLGFIFPTGPVIISIIFITIIVGIIMKYSLNKINKQNIIDTIRKDNI